MDDDIFAFQSSCILSALNLTDENTIISVKLQNYSNATPLEAFNALKVNCFFAINFCFRQFNANYRNFQEQCISIMEQISYEVNSQSAELMAHQLLSVYKMAEVQIVSPEVNRSPVMFSLSLLLFTLSILQILMQSFSQEHLLNLC